MGKSADAFRTISEVAELLQTPTHVLRFWESKFPQIRPVKRAGGRRYYRPGDVALLGGIRQLLHDDGLSIRAVQKMLREEGVTKVSEIWEAQDLDEDSAAEAVAEQPAPETAERPEAATPPQEDTPPSEAEAAFAPPPAEAQAPTTPDPAESDAVATEPTEAEPTPPAPVMAESDDTVIDASDRADTPEAEDHPADVAADAPETAPTEAEDTIPEPPEALPPVDDQPPPGAAITPFPTRAAPVIDRQPSLFDVTGEEAPIALDVPTEAAPAPEAFRRPTATTRVPPAAAAPPRNPGFDVRRDAALTGRFRRLAQLETLDPARLSAPDRGDLRMLLLRARALHLRLTLGTTTE